MALDYRDISKTWDEQNLIGIRGGKVFWLAIKIAIEKQIQKKPNVEGDGFADGTLVYDTWICPNCEKHYEIDYDDYEYCPNCGQHIDRSELNLNLQEERTCEI